MITLSRENMIIIELERIWEEVVMAYFEVELLPKYLHGNH
jgi:hypothetical protein